MSRIAYIFFGQVKNFDEKQYEAFQQNVGNKLKDHDVDYFLTTSRSTEYHSPRQQEAEGQQVSIDPESIQQYFNFKDVFYDDQSRESEDISGLAKKLVAFGDAWDSHSLTSTENSLKQLYGLEYFWHQFKGIAKNYDFFILSRCDLFHTHAFDVDCLSKDVDLLTPYYDGFEEIDYGQFGGLNDRFAVAKNVLGLAVYCARYSSIKNSQQYYHAETYLKQHIEHHKLTTDKIHNFYFLLYRANCKISDLVGIENDEQMNTELNGIDKSYFINLDRRLDRLGHIYKNNPFFAQRISAVDAKKIQLNEEVKKLFPKTWSSRSKAEICCAISHYRLWQKLAHEKSAANYLILEDDAVFKNGFVNFWNEAFSKQMPNDYSIIYLGGCQPWNKPHYPKVLERYNDYFCRIKKNDFFTKDDYFWHMNASSYVLSKTAASLLCQWVEQNGMDDALDNFMQRFFNENKLFAAPKSIYHLNPLMSYQLHEENDNTEIDKNSDLRYADEKFEEYKKCHFDIEGVEVILPNDNDNRHEFYRDFAKRSGCEVILRSLIMYLYEQNFLSKRHSIIDLGAWIGDNAIPWSKIISGNVYAIDPSRENVDYIQELKNLNNAENLKIIKSAVSDKDKTLYFSGDEKHITFQSKGEFGVPARSLDSFFVEGLINNVEFLHLDVEGQEHNVMVGSKTIIQKFRPLIVWENHLDIDDYMNTVEMLAGLNYETFLINESFPHCRQDCRNLFSIHKDKLNDLKIEKINDYFKNIMNENKFDANKELLIKINLKKSLIPKKIFQTWENDKLKGVFKYLTDKVKSHNHLYSYEFFDAEQRRGFIKDNFEPDVLECYDLIIPGAFKADLWRYCVLYKYGGIYCDIDMLCFSCFDKVIDGDEIDFFAPIDINPREDICSHAVSNAFIGSSPGHPIIKTCIDLIVQNVISERWINEGMIDLDFSGPGLLGRAINLFLGRDEKSKLKGCEGIIEKDSHKIKLIYFKQGSEYMTNLDGDIIFQNKNGNRDIKELIVQQEKGSNVKPWIEHMIGGKLPYIKKDNTSNISLINPTAISHENKQYTLYRGEKYLKHMQPPLGFNRSELSYWIECNGIKKQCIFDFGDYSYKTMRRVDIEKHENISMVEDLRFVESSVKNTENGLTCLATCSLLPYIRIYQGTKNEDGTYNKNKPVGIEYFFRMAYCEVNLTKGIIKYKGMIDESSQVQNEKNWTSFVYNKKFFVIYSMFPLRYTTADSIGEISFRDQDVSGKILMSCSTNPINVGGNRFAMLCHKRNKDKDFHYDYNLVSFEVVDSKIVDINQYNVNIGSGLYCSSILMEGDKIKVFAGQEDIDNVSFYIDLPWLNNKSFPRLSLINHKQIPKKIHLSWKNKNVLNSNYSLIKKGAKNLELLNPDWDIEVNDDEDVNRYIRDNIGKSSWELIKDRKITEKTDLWRLLKIYKEGGLYVDIDRYIDTPLSDIIKANTSCVIPTFQDIDFSQDFVLSCANNPMIERAISNNLFNRKNGQNLFYTAVCSYMHAASEFLSGQKVERGDNPVYFNDIRKQIESCEYLETFREIGPEYHTLYRNIAGDFNMQTFEKDKADFYNGESVVHWNVETQAKHTQLKNTNKQKLVFLQRNLFEEDFISELFEDCDVVYDTEMNRVIDDSVIVYSNGSSTENVWKYSAEIAQNLFDFQNKLRNYFEQCKNKNCILVHLGDEHCHAEIDYYKNFKHVFRQYHRKDASANNVTFIPLGYKKGFLK